VALRWPDIVERSFGFNPVDQEARAIVFVEARFATTVALGRPYGRIEMEVFGSIKSTNSKTVGVSGGAS